jgi:hypothetical protein
LAFQKQFNSFVKNTQIHILARTSFAAAFQFGLAGLGITIVSVYRRESFCSHGLKFKNTLKSIGLCVLCFVPYIIFSAVTGQIESYLPFQNVWMTRGALASGFPNNVIAMTIITLAWGFFEGFNYVVISDKINKRFPSKSKLLNWGAIACAVMCVLIHGMIGVTLEGVIEMLAVMIIIYGMLLVKESTGNAWGCVFIFVFIWNAF